MGKTRFGREVAQEVFHDLQTWNWNDCCVLWKPAGSFRRGKVEIGDLEIVYVPRWAQGSVDLFGAGEMENQAESMLESMWKAQVFEVRLTKKGTRVWGEKNKLAVHNATGLPVDFFATTEKNFWNYLVCRTGGKKNNIEICEAARRRGMKWRPYEDGFDLADGTRLHCETEQAVFAAVGLPWKEPWERK